eukprot:scaffold17717_cov112-Isochrysis_galbana.AAC.8
MELLTALERRQHHQAQPALGGRGQLQPALPCSHLNGGRDERVAAPRCKLSLRPLGEGDLLGARRLSRKGARHFRVSTHPKSHRLLSPRIGPKQAGGLLFDLWHGGCVPVHQLGHHGRPRLVAPERRHVKVGSARPVDGCASSGFGLGVVPLGIPHIERSGELLPAERIGHCTMQRTGHRAAGPVERRLGGGPCSGCWHKQESMGRFLFEGQPPAHRGFCCRSERAWSASTKGRHAGHRTVRYAGGCAAHRAALPGLPPPVRNTARRAVRPGRPPAGCPLLIGSRALDRLNDRLPEHIQSGTCGRRT